MTFELTMLAWTLVLAFVQILLFDFARSREYGMQWNTGPRDEEMPPLSNMANRLKRAQDNLFETLPLFIGFVLIANLAGKDGTATHWGTLIYLVGRVVYVPLYAMGVRMLRSLVWIVSLVGLLMVAWAVLA